MIKIKKETFSGTSKVFDGELADAIRGIAQYQAAVKLDTAAVTALTNSAGGSPSATSMSMPQEVPVSALSKRTSLGQAYRLDQAERNRGHPDQRECG